MSWNETDFAPIMKAFDMRKAFIAVCLLALGVALIPVGRVCYRMASDAWFYFGPPQKPLDYSNFERIVELVRQTDLALGETKQFTVDDVLKPKALIPVIPPLAEAAKSMRGRVWAERSADGNLKVVIQTLVTDKGHEYGFATADTPPAYDDSTDWLILDFPGPLIYAQKDGMLGKRNDRWWLVENHPGFKNRAEFQTARSKLKATPTPPR